MPKGDHCAKDQSLPPTFYIGKGMKIGFSGASNCGKTTAAQQLATDMKLPLIEEGFKAFTAARQAARSPSQMLLAHIDIIANKLAAENKVTGGFIADRTPIDVVMMFCLLPEPGRNKMPSKAVATFIDQAREGCRNYDYVVIPPWAVFNYHDPEHWNPETSRPKMNPWTNYSRHMMIHGIAADWLKPDQIISPPADVLLDGKISQWLMQRIGYTESVA